MSIKNLRRHRQAAPAWTGAPKVTGLTRFADDVMLPRAVHCKLLRSSVPHAIIESIDVSRARGTPACTWCSPAGFPVTFGILPVTQVEYPLAPSACASSATRSPR
jgi:xanthine dehydrogenase molybdopterin-binding subunit B